MKEKGKSEKRSLLVSVTSGKGGVGKTLIVVNLASLLAEAGRRVLVMDCDLGLANVDLLLGLNPAYTLMDMLEGRRKIEEIVVETSLGFDVLPAASGMVSLADVSAEEQGEIMAALKTLLDRYPLVLLDTGAGISSPVLRFNRAAHKNIVVLTPEPTSVTDAYALIKLLRQRLADHRIHLLVNMAQDGEEGRRVGDNLSQTVERFLKCSLSSMGHVVMDPAARRSVLARLPFVKSHPETPAAVCLRAIAEQVLAWEPEGEADPLGHLIRP
jgi:flagellar biosynthesis protein FlhG